MEKVIFEQLMITIRKQDELVHNWTKTLLTVQGGCIAALSYIFKENNIFGNQIFIAIFGIIVIGIMGSWICTKAIESDLKWQGQLIVYVKKIDPTNTLYNNVNIVVGKRGKQANLFYYLNFILIFLWILFFIFFIFYSFYN